jgi:hypothetical protein
MLSVVVLRVTFSIDSLIATLSINDTQHDNDIHKDAGCCYAECRILYCDAEWHYAECLRIFIALLCDVMLIVFMLRVIMLSVIMLSVIMLNVIMLSIIMQSIIMLIVVMLSGVIQSVIMLCLYADRCYAECRGTLLDSTSIKFYEVGIAISFFIQNFIKL